MLAYDYFDPTKFNRFRNEVAQIESKGRYNIAGGHNEHYDGKYQLGKDAKADAARIIGKDLKHDTASRKSFRENPDLQEEAFQGLVIANHKALSHYLGDKYTSMPEEEQLALLGYAHNQGAKAASRWAQGGDEGFDAFGTGGSKYYDAIHVGLGSANPAQYVKYYAQQAKETAKPIYKDLRQGALSLYDEAKDALDGDEYIVTAGDNPYSIAKAHGMTLEELQALNPENATALGQGSVNVDQELKVGKGGFESLF